MVYSCTCSARKYAALLPSLKLTSARTNHLTAVLSESAPLIPPTGIAYKPRSAASPASTTSLLNPSASSPSPSASSTLFPSLITPFHSPLERSPLFKTFAVECGFNSTLVDIFHDIGYLFAIIDAFTRRLLPSFRKGFEEIVAQIEVSSNNVGCSIEEIKTPKTSLPRPGSA